MHINLFERSLTNNQAIAGSIRETIGTEFKLSCTFFTGHIKDFLFRHVQYGLHDERGFTDSRLTAYQDKRTRHKSATQYAIQFIIVHIDAWLVVRFNIAKCQWFGFLCFNARHRAAVGRFFPYDFFNIRIPFSTRRTFTHPFR